VSQSLEDIAKLAGVSRSTVSRVVNNHPNVSLRTRQKVMQVIHERHYRPNLAARALVTQHTQVISLVIPQDVVGTFTDPYFPTLMQGVMIQANMHDYAIMLWIGCNIEEEERFFQRVLGNSLFDGIILASAVEHDPLIPWLVQSGYPFILLGPPQLDNLNFIDVDNVRGGQLAVAHLVQLGHRRVGTITGPLNMGSALDRLKGYRQALEAAAIPVDDSLIVEGRFDESSGYMAMKTLLQRGVDAVFAASDMMAVGALHAISEAGLRVPEDIGLVGFDDLPVAGMSNPPLTTVHQPIREMGSLAAQALINLIKGQITQPYQLVLPPELVIRSTCGACVMSKERRPYR
jgi:LacI family transcriptional regulator